MKKAIGYILAGLVGFAAGGVAGWLGRKKMCEVKFEVEDIQVADEEMTPEETAESAKEKIDKLFQFSTKQTEADISIAPEVDTQKEQYFKKWKAEEAIQKYDTRTKEDPEDPVVVEDLEEGMDPDFIGEIEEEAERRKNLPDIEPASMEDWNHWEGIQDGDYDCETIYWFEGDGVLADENGDAIDNPGKYVGFDVVKKFHEIDADTTGDPDIRVVYNHKKGAIFQIIRRKGSFTRMRGMEEFGSDYDGDNI